MKTRFAICHTVNGYPRYAFPNQGRNHYDTMNEALYGAKVYAPSLMEKMGFKDIHARVVLCYDNGDGQEIRDRIDPPESPEIGA